MSRLQELVDRWRQGPYLRAAIALADAKGAEAAALQVQLTAAAQRNKYLLAFLTGGRCGICGSPTWKWEARTAAQDSVPEPKAGQPQPSDAAVV
jgi:hypothetical protein